MEEFDHLKIQLKDVILATHNFAPNKLIGGGGFGSVYKGELPCPEGLIKLVACKRLDRKFGQGNVEFLKEIVMLSKYKHQNLVSLLHFCIEGDERILVYEYASRGSLDRYLSDPSLTWTQRLKICTGAAQALDYLHHPSETHQRILHRDIKSSNILLDEEWNAKVSDFGLSKIGPANQPQTYLVSNAVGTIGYCDPLYSETGILSKESDVYSFGVMLFEVMCGKLCCEYCDGRFVGILVPMWKKRFEEKRLDDIISHGLQNMEPGCLTTFSTMAYQCLKGAREERPTMAEIIQKLERIIQKLEMALEQQELFEDIGKRMRFEEMQRIADLAVSPLSYITQNQLMLLLMKGILVDNGNTWFSINKDGQHCELISARKCIPASEVVFSSGETWVDSRFQYLYNYFSRTDLRLKVTTQFLSPNVTYIINLVYRCKYSHTVNLRIPFKYKLEKMRQCSTSCIAHVGDDGWLRTELFQFTSTKKEHCFDIQFFGEMENAGYWFKAIAIFIEGVEFCPVDFEKDENKVDMQLTDIDWGKRLPDDYIKIVKDVNEESMSRKEVYFLLRKGVYINNSQQWFSISKKSQKRLMLPARAVLPEKNLVWRFLSRRKRWQWMELHGSRFKEAAVSCDYNRLAISLQFETQLLSPDIMYACYLVFKLPENASVFEGIVEACLSEMNTVLHALQEHYIYLVTPPRTPIISLSPADERPSRTRKIKGHPKLRKDGWMEIQVWEFLLDSRYDSFSMNGCLESLNEWNFTGLLVQGIELRPAKFW